MAKIEIDNKKMLESLRKAMWYFPEAEWLTRSIDTALSEQGLTVNDKGEITTIEPEVKWYVALNDYGHYINTIGAVPLFLKGERTTKENVFNMCKDIMGYEITEEEFNKNFRPATKEDIQKYALENPLVGEFDFPDYDKPATEEEIPLKKTLVEVYQASVDSATKEPEPKKCLFTKDLYTDEERKELCEGCQEECELNKDIEPKERKVSSVLKNMLDNIDEESLAKTREEMQKTPEIAEFDKAIETLIGNIDGDYCVHISSYDDYINKFAPKILAAARKLIASEIDATQMTREIRIKEFISLTLGAAYYQGIVNTIKKIKGENV